MRVDFLIIGAGIAGLNIARLIPKDYSTVIISKGSLWDCNTFYAQGGIATAKDKDDVSSHIEDTLKAGDGLSDIQAVKKMSENSIEAIQNLIDNGFKFDSKNGKLLYTKEAAHSTNRILHADGDATGRVLHKFLLLKTKHKIYTDSIVVDLFIKDKICYGAEVIIEGESKKIYANYTIIASGGVGELYSNNTNSKSISGDIQGICIEKGISLKNMEMMQFHPTVLLKDDGTRMLLTEALRGEGAYIIDKNGKRFLFDYHKDGELAPRDVVSRAIFDYSIKYDSKIYLSFSEFKAGFFKKRFPNIYKNLLALGFEIPLEPIPISPAFHYAMGGIDVDLNSQVKNIKHLFAIGEASCTGVHGANRLASNSLLEAIVFSKIAIEHILKDFHKLEPVKFSKNYKNIKKNINIEKQLSYLMWQKVGIVRSDNRLKEALNEIESYLKLNLDRLTYLRVLTAKNIVKSALSRENSVGAHFKENKI